MSTFKLNFISAKKLYEMDLPSIDYLVDKIIMKGSLTYVVGQPASFKTGLLMSIALAGKFKNNILGYKINKPFKTMWIDEENGKSKTKYTMKRLILGAEYNMSNIEQEDILFSCIAGFKIIPDHVLVLEQAIKQYKPNLIVIDNIARCMIGEENDAKNVSLILSQLKPLIEKYGVSIVIIHHCKKGHVKTLEDIRGSSDFGAQCDNAFLIKEFRRHENEKSFSLTQLKARYTLEMEGINFNVTGDDNTLSIEFGGLIQDNVQNLYEEIRRLIIEWWNDNPAPEYRTTYLVDKIKERGFKDTSIRRAIKMLVDDRLLNDKKYGFLQDSGIGVLHAND